MTNDSSQSFSSLKILAKNWTVSGSFGQPIKSESFTCEICIEVASPERGGLEACFYILVSYSTYWPLPNTAPLLKLTKKMQKLNYYDKSF